MTFSIWVDLGPLAGEFEVSMTTKPRDWPNRAAWARDKSADEITILLKALQPILTAKEMKPEELYKRIGIAINSGQNALRTLESVGAQTEPN